MKDVVGYEGLYALTLKTNDDVTTPPTENESIKTPGWSEVFENGAVVMVDYYVKMDRAKCIEYIVSSQRHTSRTQITCLKLTILTMIKHITI